MATFRVGQRVRIKWSDGWPELAGEEGTVTAVNMMSKRSNGEIVQGAVEVAPDCWGSSNAPHPGRGGSAMFAPLPEQLEPIQPEGNKTISWEDCCFTPEGKYNPIEEEVTQ